MKRLLSLVLTLALLGALALPAAAEEDSDARLAAVTLRVKETLGIDTQVYDQFYGEDVYKRQIGKGGHKDPGRGGAQPLRPSPGRRVHPEGEAAEADGAPRRRSSGLKPCVHISYFFRPGLFSSSFRASL